MAEKSASERLSEIVGGLDRTAEGEQRRHAQELHQADQRVQQTHRALCEAVAEEAAVLRDRVPPDTGRFSPTGRGWRLPGLDLWIAWDGHAYITGDVPAGAARRYRFDSRRTPRTIFDLPSWTSDDGEVRHHVLLDGEQLIVLPGGRPFVEMLRAATVKRLNGR